MIRYPAIKRGKHAPAAASRTVTSAVVAARSALETIRHTGGLYEDIVRVHLALALLVTGDAGSAEELAGDDLSSGLLETQLDAWLLRAAVALRRHDEPATHAAADDLARWVELSGFALYRAVPARLVAAAADLAPERADFVALHQQVGGHRGRAARHLRQPAEHPSRGQVQQPNNHVPHPRGQPENASSHHVRAVLVRYRP
jgi:hypothetical protein